MKSASMNLIRKNLILLFVFLFTITSYSQQKTIDVNLNFRNTEDESFISRVKVFVVRAEDTIATGYANELGKLSFQTEIDFTSLRGIPFEKEGIVSVSPNPAYGNRINVYFRSYTMAGESVRIKVFDSSGRNFSPDGIFTPGNYFIRLSGMNADFFKAEQFIIPQEGYYSFNLVNQVQPGQIKKSGQNEGIPLLLSAEKSEYFTFLDTIYIQPGTEDYLVGMEPAPKPIPEFTFSGQLKVNKNIIFDAGLSEGASGESLEYTWNFGDGVYSGNEKAAHIYSNPGTYKVMLTTVGGYGAKDTLSQTIGISVSDIPSDTADITAYVRTNGDQAIAGAVIRVSGMEEEFVTDASGKGVIHVAVGVPVTVSVFKEGFSSQVQNLDLKDGVKFGDHYFNLVKRNTASKVSDAEYGFDFISNEGVRVSIPLEGLVNEAGNLVKGDVDVILTALDVSDKKEVLAFPGEFAGISPDGDVPMLLSYGVAEYIFEKNGERLQLNEGKFAEIEIPVFITTHSDGSPVIPGDESPVWSLDEKTGLWVQEGTGIVVESESSPTGMALRTRVSHFTWWNHDVAPDPYWVIPECKIIDKNGLPTLDIPVGGACYLEGEIEGPFGPRNRPNTSGSGRPLPLPPNIDIYLYASGGNGLYSGKSKVNGPAGRTDNIVIALSIVYSGGDGDLIAADTIFDASIEDASDRDSYTFEAEAGKSYMIGTGPAFNSTLTGKVSLFDPDNHHITTGVFEDIGFGYVLSPSETGVYTVSIEGTTNFPGAYTFSLEEVPVIDLNSNFTFISYFNKQIKKAIFYAEKDDIIFPTIFGENSKYSVSLRDPNGRVVLSGGSRTLLALGFYKTKAAGYYSIELISGNLNITSYQLGLAKVNEPYEYPDNEEISVFSDSIGVLGKPFFAKFTGTKGQVINYSLDLQDSLSVYYYLYKPGEEEFYQRQLLRDDDVVNFHGKASGDPYPDRYALPGDGEYVLKVIPGRVADLTDLKGKFSLSLFRPESREIITRQSIDDSIKVQFNIKRYHILLDKPLSLSVLHRNMTKSGYLYTYVYDKTGKEVKNMRSNTFTGSLAINEMSEIYLDSIVYIEMNPSGIATGLYEFEIVNHEDPLSLDTNTVPWGEISGEIDQRGDIDYYEFSAEAGDLFGLNLLKDQSSTLEGNIRVYKLNSDSPLKFTGGSLINDAWYSSSNSDFTGMSTGLTLEIPETGKYIVRVDGKMEQYTGTKGVGEYTLRSGIIKPGDEIIVDSRENPDPQAVTGFVKLALRAIKENGNIIVKAGDYFEPGNAQIRRRNVSFTGADTSTCIIEFTGTEGFDVYNNGIKFSKFKLNSASRGFYFRQNVDSTVIDQVKFTGRIFVDGYSGNDYLSIRNSATITTNSGTIVGITGNHGLLENNSFNVVGGIALNAIQIRGDYTVIRNNTIGSQESRSISFNGIGLDGDSLVVEGNILNTYTSGIVLNGRSNDRSHYAEIKNNKLGKLNGSNGGNSDGIIVGYFDNVHVYNNEFVDFTGVSRGIRFTQSGGRVYNNRIRITSGDAIHISNIDTSPELVIVNNTIVKSGTSTTYVNIRILNNGGTLTPVRILNNIMKVPETTSASIKAINSQTAILESDYNLFSGFVSPYSINLNMGDNDLDGDPMFIDTDFHIDSSSPAWNTGTALNAPTYDFEGTSRPSGLSVDIGADEFEE